MSTTHHILSFLRAPAACLAVSVLCALPCRAADLSRQEAEGILQDTHTIAGYMEIAGESDYAAKPDDVIAAALFGAFDAKMAYAWRQEQRKESGKKPLDPSVPLFTVAGQALAPSEVVLRSEAPDRFKGLSDRHTAFISRKALELSSLRYTGHAITRHAAPEGSDLLGDVILNDKGYFVCIDGLGDLMVEAVLRQVSPQDGGYLLTGELLQSMGDDGARPGEFKLILTPGEVPGTWKRQYVETVPGG